MPVTRRALLAGAALAPAMRARAADPARIVVNFPPGGLLDGSARLIAERAQRQGGGPVLVENRPGGAGLTGAGAVAAARPDGQTVLMSIETTFTVTPHILRGSPDPYAALQPVALIASFPLVLMVPAATPIDSLAAFTAWARRQPLFYTSAGIGTPAHLAMELLRQRLDLPRTAFEHVPQRGNSDALTALFAGSVQAGFLAIGGAPDLVRDGRLRALAVSAPTRYPALPEVPTMGELGVAGFDVRIAVVMLAPRGTPEAAGERWRAASAAVLADPAARRRFLDWGLAVEDNRADSARAWLDAARTRWGEVVRAADIRE